MRTYTPDKWVVLEFDTPGHGKFHKVFGSWGGGYLDGQSWKLSSGFDKTLEAFEDETNYHINNFSGSAYSVSKHEAAYGMTGYAQGVYCAFLRQAEDAGSSIRIVDREEVAGLLNIVNEP